MKLSVTSSELAEVRTRFDSYASVHGDLFEDSFQPLTEEDTKDAVARRARFSKRFWILYACALAGIAVAVYFSKPVEGTDYYSIGSLIVFPLIYRLMIVSGFDQALKKKEKRVIHGVIKNKGQKGKGVAVEFSRKLSIRVRAKDFKTLSLGDIVKMEMLADELYINRKFVIEGKI